MLDDLGVSKKESHNWQAIAAAPDDLFNEYIAERRAIGNSKLVKMASGYAAAG